MLKSILPALVTSITALNLGADEARIDWMSINSGGGLSSWDPITMVSSIGSPTSGTLHGAGYAIKGGFLSGYSGSSDARTVSLRIEQGSVGLLISWPSEASDWTLEVSPTLAGPWVVVPGPFRTNDPNVFFVVPHSQDNQFYLLRRR